MGEENNFYLAPWVREYKEKEKARQIWLLQLAEKYALSVENSKHPNGHYMNELVVTPLGTSLGTVSSDAMLDNLVSTLRKSAAKERKLSREMILHIHEGQKETAKWLAPLVMAPAFITTGGPIMQMLARPLTTTARVASTIFPKAARVLPYTLMADRGIMGYLGTTGMYNTGKKWYKGKIPWYKAVPLMALEGLMVADAAPLVKTAGKAAIKGADYTARRMYAPYDFYRIIQETTPRITPPLEGFYASDLTGNNFVETVYTGSPIFEFGQTMRTSPEKAYFMMAPKDIDILKLRNGLFRHEVVGNEILPSGEVDGKFVSYGEPWQEFALGENSALYEFPVGPRRDPSLIATDWKGRPQKYSVDEIYDYMQRELALHREFRKDVVELGLNKLEGAERVKAYKALKEEKYPELLLYYDTSIHGANQTVIPNERWNFDRFLKTPFWKYSEDPLSGQVQKELFMNWPTTKMPKGSTLTTQILPKLLTIEISPEELYKFFLNQKDYYFMGHGTARTNVTPETIFESGLRIKNGEISNTTSPISETNLASWPHLNSEEVIILPGKASNSKYDSVYGYIPSDWYSSDVFHWTDNPEVVGHGPFAVRKPNATFTETTRNGISGVFTKPEAILGSYNIRTHILKLNPNSLYLFSFNTPKVDKRLSAILNASPESVLLSFESRLPYATSANKPLVRALPGNRQNNLEIVDNFMNKLKIDHPNATDKELEDIFYLTYGVTAEDVLDSHGMSITDDVTGEAEIVRYDNTRSPLRNMLSKTHEENHTMFNLSPRFFKHETVTAIESPGGYTKNYLNEKAGFELPDLNLNNPEFELAEYLEAMEISSYMSEYKSLLGKQKNEPLTEEDIKWFITHKDVIGNKIIGSKKYYDYIAEHITDPKKFAKWVTEFSNIILPPVIGGSSLLYLSNSLKHKQGGKIDLLLFMRKGKSIKVKNYPVVDALSEGLEDWFKLNPEVAGMAIGKGLNGIKGKRRIVINPFSNALQTEKQKKGLVLLESVRHAMDKHKYHPNFELTPTLKNLQLTKFKDLNLPYAYDDEAFKQSIISRILVGDDWDLDVSKELLEEAKKFKFK